MKKIYILIRALCITACSFVCCTQQSYAALSGAYTINPSVAASATNYLTFQSAVSDLLSGTRADGGIPNGTGVSGPVTFNVAPGTYTGQIEFIGTIPGASATNMVTFEGADAATRIIEYASYVNSSRHTIRLESTQYVSFRNFTIRTLGDYGWAIHLNGLNTSSVKIKHCIIEMAGPGVAATLPTHVGILANVSITNIGNGGGAIGYYCDSIEIDSNTIMNGYCSIVLLGEMGSDQINNRIRNNRLLNQSNWAIWAMFHDGIHVTDNEVRPRSYGYGITLENVTTNAPNSMIVSGNDISNFGLMGLNLFNCINYSGTKTQVFNNMLSNGSGTGLRIDGSEEMAVSNNSVTIRNAFSWVDDAACYVYSGVNLTLYNNIFAVTEENEILPFFAIDPFAFDSMDYNVLYRPDVTDKRLIYIDGVYDENTFAGAYGYNTNSLYRRSSFVNDTNLRVLNTCDKGIPFPFVTEDIDGNLRNTPPTIGAHEGILLRHNLLLRGVEAPVVPIVTGLQDLMVSVQNLGDSIIASFDVTYVHNGNAPVTQAWMGTLNPCDTAWVVFTGARQVNMDTINAITIYTSMPNGVADPYTANDTISRPMYTALHGHYTIGSGPGASFPSFTDAVDALKLAGVSDSVIFDVEAGTYAETVPLDDDILGVSASHTITFDGIDAATRIIDYDATGMNEYVTFTIKCDHVRVKNLTIRATSAEQGCGVHIGKPEIKDIRIRHCIIDIPNAIPSDVFGGIIMNDFPTVYYDGLFRADSIEIDSNIIYGGLIGIGHQMSFYNLLGIAPSEHVYIRNNELYNNTMVGINSQGVNDLVVSNNKIVMDMSQNENVSGISILNGTGFRITGNTIKNVSSQGILVAEYFNNFGNRGLVANNSIVSSGYDGIYMEWVTELDIMHNSVKLDKISTFPMCGALNIRLSYSGFTSSGLVVTNNNFAVTASGTSAAAFTSDDLGAFTTCDYNNFYKPDTSNVAYLDGVWYSKSDMLGASGLNANSISQEPQFIDDSTLISTNPCMNGVFTAAVPADINGIARPAFPDMGAYEIPQFGNDLAVVSIVTPTYPVDSGMQDLHVLIANRGNNTVTSGNVSYRLNGGAAVTQPLPSPLGACDTMTIIFTGANQINITYAVQNMLSVYTASPNAGVDSNMVNDTLKMHLATPMNGAYTIGATGADYITVNEAVTDLGKRGVSGPVVFNIKTGVYTEQVMLMNANGMSAVNTVTFTSEANHMDSARIEYGSSSAVDNYVVKLQGASNFNFTYLNIANTSGTGAIDMNTASSNNTVDHCRLECGPSFGTLGINHGGGVTADDYYTGSNLTITNNIITGGMVGIMLYGQFTQNTSGNIVSGNTISGFYFAGIYTNYTSHLKVTENTINAASSYFSGVNAIWCYNSDTAIELSKNRITVTTGGYGITMQGCDGTNAEPILVTNNIIRISGNKASYGIRCQASSRVKIYHNTVSVNSPASSYAAYLHYNGTAYRFNEIRNNVFSNTGNGVAMYYHTPLAALPNAVVDYNNLYATGINLVQRGTPSTSYANLNAWRALTAATLNPFDVHSLSYRPGFTSASNLTPNPADSASWSLNGRGIHLDSTLISTDINGTSRPNTRFQGAPDIGAIEFTPVSAPPMSVAVPAQPSVGVVQTFFFGSDTVARITWDPGMPVPANIAVRYYSGETAPYVSSTALATKSYWSILADTGSYAYNVEVYYAEPLLGNLPDEAEMKTAKYVDGAGWNVYQYTTSEADTALNILRALPAFSEYSMVITGTDNLAPLPVKLVSFTAAAKANDVLLSWNTAAEVNNKGFVVQRAKVYGQWEDIGFVNGAGNSNTMHQYTFMDYSAFAPGVPVLYYRLKQVDYNGAFTYSPVANVTRKAATATQLSVYPNPFNDRCSISFNAAADGQVSVVIYDLQGRVAAKHNAEIAKGNNTIILDELGLLQTGVYMMKVRVDGETQVLKMIRQ